MAKPAADTQKTTTEDAQTAAPKVRWNSANLKSSYANVCNVSSTREEVILNFGVNQAWERGQPELEIELNSRVILSPFAAKRLSMMLSKLVQEYEARHGELKLDVAQAQPSQGAADAAKH